MSPGAIRVWAVAAMLACASGSLAQQLAIPGSVDRVALGLSSGFIENAGQWDTDARYVGRLGAVTVRAEPGAVLLQHEAVRPDGERSGSLLRLGFDGEAANVVPRPRMPPLPGVNHFFLGRDPTAWRTQVRRYDQVAYDDLYPGIAVVLRSGPDGLALTLQAPTVEALDRVALRFDGAESPPSFDNLGRLVLRTTVGELRLRRPQLVDPGLQSTGSIGYRLTSDGLVRLEPTEPGQEGLIVVDLRLEWSTYLGGTDGGEYPHALTLDALGRAVIGGETMSLTFPSTPGAFDATFNGGAGSELTDAFVSCLEADGSGLVFSTYLGGGGNEQVEGIAVDPSGDVVVAGFTASSLTFPTTLGAWDTVGNSFDSFVTRLVPDGSALVFSTYLGGASTDSVSDLLLMPDGRIVVTGTTLSTDFPTTPAAFDRSIGGPYDGFLSILNATGSTLDYSTFIGGSGGEEPFGLALRPDSSIAIVGRATATDWPMSPGAFDPVLPSGFNAKGFAFALDPETNAATCSTYLAGFTPRAVAAHSDGDLVIVGDSSSTSFPATPGAYDTTYNGSTDGAVLRLVATGSSLVYATYLGGTNIDNGRGVALDSAGRPTVLGHTKSNSFPTTPGALVIPDPLTFSNYNVTITRLSVDGSRLLYSSRLGGDPTGDTLLSGTGHCIALDDTGAATAAAANGFHFPVTPGAYDTDEPVAFDAVVFRLTMLPTGALKFGASTPGDQGPLAIGVNAMPSLGTTGFAITCLSAPASSGQGFLLLALSPLTNPLPVKGAALWVDPAQLFLIIPVGSNADGYSELPLTIPNQPQLLGVPTYWQYAWRPPGGGIPWSMSNALELTIQP